MSNVNHWLITRFNVPMPGFPGRSLDRRWLETRLRLFNAFCLPSVARQTCQDFRWVVLIDRTTPRRVLAALRDCAKWRRFLLLGVGSPWRAELAEFIGRESSKPLLFTSRLDSDDAIRRSYVQSVRSSFEGQAPVLLVAASGLRLNTRTGRLNPVTWLSGAFVTLVERRSAEPLTVYCCPHPDAYQFAPLCPVRLQHAWMQVVHQANLKNRAQLASPLLHHSVLRGW
jgi:hypothetical protein